MSATTRDSIERQPAAALVVREHGGVPYYEAKFRIGGRQIKRRIGEAWLERLEHGWQPRRGRVQAGCYDVRGAHVRAAALVDEAVKAQASREQLEQERRNRQLTFRDLAHEYRRWLETEYGAKPATLRDHDYLLAEPGTPHQRGTGTAAGQIMSTLGDKPAARITRDEIRELLAALVADGLSARNINKHRNLIGAIFNHGVRRGTGRHKLAENPVVGIEQRREAKPAALIYYTPEEIETIAQALTNGSHRDPQTNVRINDEERAARQAEDAQDAEAVRLAAYTGLRRGELIALQWNDIDFANHKITVSRAISANTISTPKSGSYRDVPLSAQAAAALSRLKQRDSYTGPGDLVLCNRYGRRLNAPALTRRYNRARIVSGLRPLRWHDLRHTFGSLLVAAGIDTVSVKAAMGHSRITTTERYLHARPATQQAAAFTAAFASQHSTGQTSTG
jgi:integrase